MFYNILLLSAYSGPEKKGRTSFAETSKITNFGLTQVNEALMP